MTLKTIGWFPKPNLGVSIQSGTSVIVSVWRTLIPPTHQPVFCKAYTSKSTADTFPTCLGSFPNNIQKVCSFVCCLSDPTHIHDYGSKPSCPIGTQKKKLDGCLLPSVIREQCVSTHSKHISLSETWVYLPKGFKGQFFTGNMIIMRGFGGILFSEEAK